jgi:predicted alpha/beta hydrolase
MRRRVDAETTDLLERVIDTVEAAVDAAMQSAAIARNNGFHVAAAEFESKAQEAAVRLHSLRALYAEWVSVDPPVVR